MHPNLLAATLLLARSTPEAIHARVLVSAATSLLIGRGRPGSPAGIRHQPRLPPRVPNKAAPPAPPNPLRRRLQAPGELVVCLVPAQLLLDVRHRRGVVDHDQLDGGHLGEILEMLTTEGCTEAGGVGGAGRQARLRGAPQAG